MKQINVDFSQDCGKVKPMHAVNNGPVHKFSADQRISNLQWFIDAGIPYARTHDAAFYATYGGERTVDITAIFPDFDKDPNDPESYDFVWTDEYLKVMDAAGTKPFYRLGQKIEHGVKKYGTYPPKDFKKWAVICEHIIRHYTEGWAEGFNYDIEYWEIWNEPDCQSADGTSPTWQGTQEQFIEFFCTALEHLKGCFPHLKIGGPAFCWVNKPYIEAFLGELKERKLPLDFLSWHCYARDPEWVIECTLAIRELLDKYGFTDTESNLNEWNYVRGWIGDDWIYSLKTEKNIKGAAFVSSVLLTQQYLPLDMLMYYDARPCGMNGLFSTDMVCDRLKGYYILRMFNELYKLGKCVPVECDGEFVYACAAKGDDKAAVMLTYYADVDERENEEVKVNLKSLGIKDGKVKIYLHDRERDMELVGEEEIGENDEITLNTPLFGTYLLIAE